MRAGALRHPVVIQQPSATLDASGASPIAWSEFARVWAEVRPLQGREAALARELFAEATVAVRTRFLQGITPAMRILFRSRYLNIVGVMNVDERDHEMQILCREVVF